MGFWIGLAFLVVAGFWLLVEKTKQGLCTFKKWRATGYCRHRFKLYSTHSFGSYADYKCEHCGEKRVMRL